eukprot:g65584.t1
MTLGCTVLFDVVMIPYLMFCCYLDRICISDRLDLIESDGVDSMQSDFFFSSGVHVHATFPRVFPKHSINRKESRVVGDEPMEKKRYSC